MYFNIIHGRQFHKVCCSHYILTLPLTTLSKNCFAALCNELFLPKVLVGMHNRVPWIRNRKRNKNLSQCTNLHKQSIRRICRRKAKPQRETYLFLLIWSRVLQSISSGKIYKQSIRGNLVWLCRSADRPRDLLNIGDQSRYDCGNQMRQLAI